MNRESYEALRDEMENVPDDLEDKKEGDIYLFSLWGYRYKNCRNSKRLVVSFVYHLSYYERRIGELETLPIRGHLAYEMARIAELKNVLKLRDDMCEFVEYLYAYLITEIFEAATYSPYDEKILNNHIEEGFTIEIVSGWRVVARKVISGGEVSVRRFADRITLS